MKFRLLQTGYQSAYLNMAIDEAVLKQVSQGKVKPTLRFYGWKPAAVSIGYFQSMAEEVDLNDELDGTSMIKGEAGENILGILLDRFDESPGSSRSSSLKSSVSQPSHLVIVR